MSGLFKSVSNFRFRAGGVTEFYLKKTKKQKRRINTKAIRQMLGESRGSRNSERR
ncbi:hypothetical protein CBUD_1559a [Coxiella burnetii Dugway 5J108-111]|uniref:Uncharacterized protein n=1 Tax=Coxiella burnetii (strain Dugway 5J108-111) TaxID=434922 RepID=B5XHG5_COXBN|nr:hypothetical protein CBUD_1559a [Coxiella burnetii Dugway 5J108-111]